MEAEITDRVSSWRQANATHTNRSGELLRHGYWRPSRSANGAPRRRVMVEGWHGLRAILKTNRAHRYRIHHAFAVGSLPPSLISATNASCSRAHRILPTAGWRAV